jgi:hypothetical protein
MFGNGTYAYDLQIDLTSVKFEDIQAYLVQKGWEEELATSPHNNWAQWQRAGRLTFYREETTDALILVLFDTRFSNYYWRLHDAIKVISKVEQRPAYEVAFHFLWQTRAPQTPISLDDERALMHVIARLCTGK